MAEELSLIGQSFKTIREYFGMSEKSFRKSIKKIRPELDKIAGRKRYINLIPSQVKLIVKHLSGE